MIEQDSSLQFTLRAQAVNSFIEVHPPTQLQQPPLLDSGGKAMANNSMMVVASGGNLLQQPQARSAPGSV